jgi:hypothetical protein
MLHFDYNIDIEYGRYIKLDPELPASRIKFQEGDLLQVCELEGGQVMLRKVDPITKFTLGFPQEEQKL